MLRNSGVDKLITKGVYIKIRSKGTIKSGNDPNTPKDQEH